MLWGAGHACAGTLPRTGKWPAILAGAILGFGWLVTLTGWAQAQCLQNPESFWATIPPIELRQALGSCNAALSLAAMHRTTALLGLMLVAIEIWKTTGWNRALILTMLTTAMGMTVFFFLQRTVGAPFQLFSVDGKIPLAFATYRYHGNAASFLNLFWPVLAGVAAYACVRRTFGWPIWLIPPALVFAACFLNVSKAGNVLAVIGLSILSSALAIFFLQYIRHTRARVKKQLILAGVLPILVILITLLFAMPWNRWVDMANSLEKTGTDGRLEAYRIFLSLVPEAGWRGFGPGTFKAVQNSRIDENSPPYLQTYWVAHQDYLQTLVDWGYLGTFLWAALFLPATAAIGAGTLRRNTLPPVDKIYRITLGDNLRALGESIPPPAHPCCLAGVGLALLLTSLHALVDFPMQIASIQLYFLVLIALGWSLIDAKDTR